MMRQEYIDHLGMSYGGRTRNIPVPARVAFVPIPAAPNYVTEGAWSQSEYGLMMADQMFTLGNNMNTAYQARKTFYSQPGNTLLDRNNTALTWPNVNMKLNSGYRNPERQERIGTAINSNHQLGNALDLGIRQIDFLDVRERAAFYQILWEASGNITTRERQLEAEGINITSGDNSKLGNDIRPENGIDDAFESADHLHIN